MFSIVGTVKEVQFLETNVSDAAGQISFTPSDWVAIVHEPYLTIRMYVEHRCIRISPTNVLCIITILMECQSCFSLSRPCLPSLCLRDSGWVFGAVGPRCEPPIITASVAKKRQ